MSFESGEESGEESGSVYVCVHVYVYVCMCVCVYVYIPVMISVEKSGPSNNFTSRITCGRFGLPPERDNCVSCSSG